MPKNPLTIRQPPLTLQILLQPTLPPNTLIKSPKKSLKLLLPSLHLLRESKQTPIQNLPNNQIRKSQSIANQKPPLATAITLIELQIPLKIRKELRQPVLADVFGLLQGSFFLLFVVLANSERVVRIVDLIIEIQRCESQLVHMMFPRLVVFRYKTQTPPKVDQNIRRLRYDQRTATSTGSWDSQGGWAEDRGIVVGA